MRRASFTFIASGAAVAAGFFLLRPSQDRSALRVAYALSSLRQDSSVLDPRNTDTIYEYYLLENLAAGLVREDSDSASGYSPGLASNWSQQGDNRWRFELRRDLRWSDGSPISGDEIVEHLLRLKDGGHRHIVHMKHLRRASFEDGAILLEFDLPVNAALIHELSLADAALVSGRNLSGDWRVVSGAYYVGSYVIGHSLELNKNKFFAADLDYPDNVVLTPVNAQVFENLFDRDPVDLVRVPSHSYYEAWQKAISRAPAVYRGYPTMLHYLAFKPGATLWNNVEARREFAALASEALSGLSFPPLERAEQFIPKGFHGRLESPSLPLLPKRSVLKGKTLKIGFQKPYAQAEPILTALRDRFAEAGVKLDFNFTIFPPEDDPESSVLFQLFAGNQRDPLGSWKFLFSEGRGSLGRFFEEVVDDFDEIAQSRDSSRRDAALRGLHEKALREAYGVPLFVEPVTFLASNRIDLTRINRFDMRMRFFEIRWK